MKRKTNISVMDNLGIRREINIEVGEQGSYSSGDILDANATSNLVEDKIKTVIGNAADALDTLEELGGAIPTKISQLLNDAGFIQKSNTVGLLKNDGTVDTKTYLTQHLSIATKADKATTLSGYGITDAKIESGTITLGSNTITPLTQHQDITNKVDKQEIEKLIENLEEGGYGIKSINGGAPIRIGNMNMHKTLPILSKMRRCVVDDGEVVGYIDPTDPTRYITGEAVDYSGGDGDIMVEIPEYYFEAYRYTDNGDTIDVLLLHPYTKKGKKSPKVYVGAFEASSDGTTLSSICTTNFTIETNTVNVSTGLSYTDNASTYRGGNKSGTNDANDKSLLGRPISSLTRAQFRSRAAAKGTGYSQQYWVAYMAWLRLYVVEYANFNSQSTYNNTLTSDGYKQGGLGNGFTTTDSTAWNNYNAYNPLCPCGITISLGNSTGYINLLYPSGTFNANADTTFTVPSYRGIENPFGHIWKWTDGININTVNGTTRVYVNNNITAFADDTTADYIERARFAKPSNNYIKTWNWDENGDFIPTSSGGTDSSYLYDYCYWSDGWMVLASGGSAYSGALAGLFAFRAVGGSGYSHAIFGGRLYFTPGE